MSDPSNSDDVIDSRDVTKRLDELTEERQELASEADPYADEPLLGSDLIAARSALDAWNADNGAELAALTALQDQAEGYADDWRHGCALIRDSYFQTYAQELAEEIGATQCGAPWPANCIDWEQAARELQQDYTAVEFDGVTYWVR